MSKALFNKIVYQSTNGTEIINAFTRDELTRIAREFTESFDSWSICRTRLPREMGFDYCRFSATESFESLVAELYQIWYPSSTNKCVQNTIGVMLAYALHLCVGLVTIHRLAEFNFRADLVTTEEFKNIHDEIDHDWVFSGVYDAPWDTGLPLANNCFHWCGSWGLRMKDKGGVPVWHISRIRAAVEDDVVTMDNTKLLRPSKVLKAIDWFAETIFVRYPDADLRPVLDGMLSSLMTFVKQIRQLLEDMIDPEIAERFTDVQLATPFPELGLIQMCLSITQNTVDILKAKGKSHDTVKED